MPSKAFLSHNSANKNFVRSVFEALGRENCYFDEAHFRPSNNLLDEIDETIDKSNLFVYFNTEESSSAPWVQHEVAIAKFKALIKKDIKVIVIQIGNKVNTKIIPQWLKGQLVKAYSNPQQATDEIKLHLSALNSEKEQLIHVGRSNENERLEEIISNLSEKKHNVLFLHGLESIGRRAFAKSKALSLLGLTSIIEIPVRAGDSALEILVQILEKIEPYESVADFRDKIQVLNSYSQDQILNLLSVAMRRLCDSGYLAMFIDKGGILLGSGHTAIVINQVLHLHSLDKKLYSIMITNRKPIDQKLSEHCIQIRELTENEASRLVKMLFSRRNISATDVQLKQYARIVSGYPPIAYWIASVAKNYGHLLLLAEHKSAVRAKPEPVIQYLFNEKKINEYQKKLLLALSYYSPLPLPVVSTLLGDTNKDSLIDLVNLIDLSLIHSTPDNHYQIANPIRETVRRLIKPDTSVHRTVFSALSSHQSESDASNRAIAFSIHLFESRSLAGITTPDDWEYETVSSHLEISINLYKNYMYSKSLEHADFVLKHRPDNSRALEIACKCCIKLNEAQLAETHIRKFQSIGDLNNYYFHLGFLARHQNKPGEALANFQLSRTNGRRGLGLERETAMCAYQIGKFDLAEQHINAALNIDPRNAKVISLAINIAIEKRDFTTAEKLLETSQAIDTDEYYSYLMSLFWSAKGDKDLALEHAKNSFKRDSQPTFEILSNLIQKLCDHKNVEAANSHLAILNEYFPKKTGDEKVKLRISIMLAAGKPSDAFKLWEGLNDKTGRSSLKLKLNVLKTLLSESSLLEQANIQSEIKSTEEELHKRLSQT